MRSIRDRGHVRPLGAGGPPAARWKRLLTAGAVTSLAAVGLAAGTATAASAAPLPPAAKVTPAAVSGPGISTTTFFYTAANGTVWTKPEVGTATQVSNGKVVGAVSGLWTGSSLVLFGEGTDHALWYATRAGNTNSWSNWASLGGGLTSAPGAVYRGSPTVYAVFVRGTDGAVWARDHSSTGWGPWHSEGGKLYAGTAPSAAYFGGITWVLVAGTNQQMYIAEAGLTGFSPVGGLTTATPALTTAPGALAGFARGTNNVAYFHRFLSSSPGWHSMGGVFTSGLSAANVAIGGLFTYTVGLGTNSQVYYDGGNWSFGYPPHFLGWSAITP
jgi:hypothetical protein